MKLRWLLVGLVVTLLLVPAGLITTARALDLPGGTWVRLTAFTPYAGVLYLLALLLLLLAWARGRGFWRGTARLLALLSLLGVAVHASWASGPFLGSSTAEAATGTGSARPVTVMTSNLRFGQADTARVVELSVRQDVDVLALQEVTPQALAGLRRAGLGRVFAHRAGRPAAGPGGTMVFSRTRLSAVRRVPTKFGSYAMDVRLPGVHGAPGGRVHLLAVHPMPPIGDVAGWHADQMVVRQAARGLDRPTILLGDLNATMDHASMRELVGRGYQDAATRARSAWQPTWPSAGVVSHLGVDVPPLVAIDHVFTTTGLRAQRTRAFTVDGTDHQALVATLAR
jgi:endonuclease/exonuclease/phosphatase (EEP) superfamily protein YafD